MLISIDTTCKTIEFTYKICMAEMGKYVNIASRMKKDESRKLENTSLKERRRRLRVEVSHLMKVVDRKLQEERLLLVTLEVEKMKISDKQSEVKQTDTMLKKMEIGGKDTRA